MKYSKLNEKNIRSDHFCKTFFIFTTLNFQDLLEKRRSAKKLKHTSFCSSIVDALVEMTYELVSLKVGFQPEVLPEVPPEVPPEVEPEVIVS